MGPIVIDKDRLSINVNRRNAPIQSNAGWCAVWATVRKFRMLSFDRLKIYLRISPAYGRILTE